MAKNIAKEKGTENVPNIRTRPQHNPDFMRNGKEFPDPTPVAPPLGFIKQPTLAETMRAMVQGEALRRAARESGVETFEEADDFEVGDDYDPTSPYEETFDPPPPPPSDSELAERDASLLAAALKKAFQEETPTRGGTPSPGTPPPPEVPPSPPEGARSAPTNPLTSFFQPRG